MKKVPFGVIVFGIILILTSVWQIYYIPCFSKYNIINPGVPEGLIMLRYCVSYLLRAAGLACGIGILFYCNIYRKALLGLFVFSILTLPLRHSYAAFFCYVKPLFHGPITSLISIEMFTWVNVLCRWAIDGLFAACGIYYFSRPAIVAHFNKGQ